MNDIEKAKIKSLVARLRDLSERDGCSVPAWMLDEERYSDSPLTPAEQQEWAESVSGHMRATVALQYLIDCGKRFGFREGEYVFRNDGTALGLTQELIENVLIKYVEEDLIRYKPAERYIAVYQFYHANEQRLNESGHSWFNEFLDEIFTDVAVRLRAGEDLPVKSIMH
ncbi:hypothetical protein B8Z58_001820 [Enterobacter roggenkampii]|nr:hypothetical protein [Enterobacter roggenkampii]